MSPFRWGILSTASIGAVIAAALRDSSAADLVVVGGRDADRARAHADTLGVPDSVGTYDEVLAREDIDAVYLPLPIALHTEWTIKALQAGKHVLCEKPFALTAADARRCFDAAAAAGKLCIEGLMYRHHPQTLMARKLVADGAIGELAYIRTALTVSAPAGDIRRTTALGGGAHLDLGCYCISAIRLFGGHPERIHAVRVLDRAPGAEDGDLRLAATFEMPDDVLAQFDVALDFPRRDELEIIGTRGTITVPDPWLCRRGYLDLEQDGQTRRVPVDAAGHDLTAYGEDNVDAYRIEFEAASRAIADGTSPTFGPEDAIDQAAVLEAVGLAARTGNPVTPAPSVALANPVPR